MRITGHKSLDKRLQPRFLRLARNAAEAACRATLGLLICFSAIAAAPETPFTCLTALASALSGNDAAGALESFDSGSKDYGAVENEINALAAQTDILCSIEIVEDTEAGEIHKLDTDWYLQLKPRAGEGAAERRRERVAIQMRRISGKWKIISIAPLAILSPIRVN